MPDLRRLLIDGAIMAGIAVVLALLGPFGMFAAPFPLRLFYWLLMAVAGYALFRPAMAAASRAARRLDLPASALWAAATALAALPMSAVVWCANFLWGPANRPTLEAAAATYANVLVVSGIACLVFWFANAKERVAAGDKATALAIAPEPPADTPPPAPKLLGRLPPHLGSELIALEMEDHYVRAHTALGSTLILLRMRDAVAELDGVDGAQVHRSWWVARAAITAVGRDGRNYRLRLSNGLEAPVARAMVAPLQADGWLG